MGVFFRLGTSDGEANPVKYHCSAGIGGKGIVPGQPRDAFGVGWSKWTSAATSFRSCATACAWAQAGERRGDVLQRGAHRILSLDRQIIEPGLKKTLDGDRLKRARTWRGWLPRRS